MHRHAIGLQYDRGGDCRPGPLPGDANATRIDRIMPQQVSPHPLHGRSAGADILGEGIGPKPAPADTQIALLFLVTRVRNGDRNFLPQSISPDGQSIVGIQTVVPEPDQ